MTVSSLSFALPGSICTHVLAGYLSMERILSSIICLLTADIKLPPITLCVPPFVYPLSSVQANQCVCRWSRLSFPLHPQRHHAHFERLRNPAENGARERLVVVLNVADGLPATPALVGQFALREPAPSAGRPDLGTHGGRCYHCIHVPTVAYRKVRCQVLLIQSVQFIFIIASNLCRLCLTTVLRYGRIVPVRSGRDGPEHAGTK